MLEIGNKSCDNCIKTIDLISNLAGEHKKKGKKLLSRSHAHGRGLCQGQQHQVQHQPEGVHLNLYSEEVREREGKILLFF